MKYIERGTRYPAPWPEIFWLEMPICTNHINITKQAPVEIRFIRVGNQHSAESSNNRKGNTGNLGLVRLCDIQKSITVKLLNIQGKTAWVCSTPGARFMKSCTHGAAVFYFFMLELTTAVLSVLYLLNLHCCTSDFWVWVLIRNFPLLVSDCLCSAENWLQMHLNG